MIEPTAINSLLLWIPLLVVMSVGQMFVIATRGIDVSVGSAVGFAAMCTGLLIKSHPGINLWIATATAVCIGTGIGVINGSLVAALKIPPIIVTLGAMSIFRGLSFVVGGSTQITSNDLPSSIVRVAQEGPIHFGDVTVSWLLTLSMLIALVAFLLSKYTVWGRNVFAIGSNPEGAHLRGVPVVQTVFGVYVLCGMCAGISAMMYINRYGFVNPASAGQGMELTVIAAAVIGGTDVRGGRGSVLGVLLGAVLLGVLNVALSVLGIDADWQLLVYGAVIIGSLVLNRSERK